mgnify:CR=1 FL=1
MRRADPGNPTTWLFSPPRPVMNTSPNSVAPSPACNEGWTERTQGKIKCSALAPRHARAGCALAPQGVKTGYALVLSCARASCALVFSCARASCALVLSCARASCALVLSCARASCALFPSCARMSCAIVLCARASCALVLSCARASSALAHSRVFPRLRAYGLCARSFPSACELRALPGPRERALFECVLRTRPLPRTCACCAFVSFCWASVRYAHFTCCVCISCALVFGYARACLALTLHYARAGCALALSRAKACCELILRRVRAGCALALCDERAHGTCAGGTADTWRSSGEMKSSLKQFALIRVRDRPSGILKQLLFFFYQKNQGNSGALFSHCGSIQP